MEKNMKRHWLATSILAVLLPFAGNAGGTAASFRLDGGTVAVTNTQANSSWVPVAVLVRFDAAATGTVVVRRVSQGNTFTLGTCTFTGATNLVWVADCEYPFGFGDVLMVASTATGGVVQILTRGDP